MGLSIIFTNGDVRMVFFCVGFIVSLQMQNVRGIFNLFSILKVLRFQCDWISVYANNKCQDNLKKLDLVFIFISA